MGPEFLVFYMFFLDVSGDCKKQLFGASNSFLQKFSIFWERKIICYAHTMFIFVHMVSEHICLDTIFGTFGIISVHNFWNFKNLSKNKYTNNIKCVWHVMCLNDSIVLKTLLVAIKDVKTNIQKKKLYCVPLCISIL